MSRYMKIVFCLPGKEYSREFLMSWTELMMQATSKGHQCMVSQNYSSVVHFARAKCLGGDVTAGPDQKPFQGKVDYDAIMWIDSDIVFKPEDFFSLLESPHDVTAGMYMMEDMKNYAIVKEWDEEYFKKNGTFEFVKAEDMAKATNRYMKVAYSGMGWMLMRKGVLEEVKYPWFYGDLQKIGVMQDMMAEDVALCRKLNEIYVDTTIRVGHQKKVIL